MHKLCLESGFSFYLFLDTQNVTEMTHYKKLEGLQKLAKNYLPDPCFTKLDF